jgi:hypothetical protein
LKTEFFNSIGRLQPVTWNLNERLLCAKADIQILPREDFVEFTLSFASSVDYVADPQALTFS